MSFLTDLGNVVNEQFGFGENTNSSLDTGTDRVENFGLLGDFAKKFDQSSERSYFEDGVVRTIRPRLRQVFFQQPDITVVFKKRMFSSLAENSRLDLLEDKERLLIRATKRLMQNKLRLLAHYERLVKIEQVAKQTGEFNTTLAPTLLNGIQALENLSGGSIFDSKTRVVFDRLRKALSYSETADVSNWTTNDYDSAFESELGEGTGTFEITTITKVNTNVGVDFGSGNASLVVEDPYKILVVTDDDITQAINDASNFFRNSFFGKFTEKETENLINRLKSDLAIQRGLRNASQISFQVSPTSIFSRRVRAIEEGSGKEIIFQYNPGIVGIGGGVEIDAGFVGNEGDALNDQEASLFKQIITNIFLLIGFRNTTQSEIKEFNKEQNYVRRRMRLFFLGQPIIQSMDIVNVFMTTKTLEDQKLTQGFQNVFRLGNQGFALGQKIDNLFKNINISLANFTGTNNRPEELEKNLIAGPEVPMWLWRMFRNDFTKQGAGTAIFVGIVKTVSHKYNSGKYELQVNCEDNAGYTEKSMINIKPALDESNSVLYDPLTPFDLSFDAATGQAITDVGFGQFPPLLPENQTLLRSRALRFKSGRFRGQRVDDITFGTDNSEPAFNGFRNVLSDPNGLVYRWKQGIQSLTKTERAFPKRTTLVEDRSPRLTQNPFAGQDVMNVLSLLVTGEPYNYTNYLKAALANANSIGGTGNKQSNESASVSYIQFLTNQLQKRNLLYGNFVPFKKLTMNQAADQFIRTAQADFLQQQESINSLIRQREAKFDELLFLTKGESNNLATAFTRDEAGNFVGNPQKGSSNIQAEVLRSEIESFDRKINDAQKRFQRTISNFEQNKAGGQIRIINDDVQFDTSLGGINSIQGEESKQLERMELQKKIAGLTLRRLWKVKANDDLNYFIVDDQYDNNFDIQAAERAIQFSTSLFNNEFTKISDKIRQVAKLLNLEIFANTQGHIEVRPPQYNKVPSSVFFQMFKERESKGIKVFPEFLERLYFNQIQGLINRIEVIEDEIRLRAVSLGIIAKDRIDQDKEIRDFLARSDGTGNTNLSSNRFIFLTDPVTGKMSRSFSSIFAQSDPDRMEASGVKTIAEALRSLQFEATKATQIARQFDSINRISAIRAFERAAANSLPSTQLASDRSFEIRERLFQKTGRPAPTIDQLFSNTRIKRFTNQVSRLDGMEIINQIGNFINERQKLVSSLSKAAKNLEEGLTFNSSDEGARNILNPALAPRDKNSIPDVLSHMIEDEDEDDLGIGSSNRFIIRDGMYSSIEINVTPPPYNVVTVNGLLGEGFVNPPDGLQTGNDGNVITSAYAVDYDTWYQFGWRAAETISAPFFSDPDSQCAPYAVFQLLQARKNILQGSVTVNVYNEFYQPGDVVYIEDRDLLFYVTNVSHSFSYGSLSTILTLQYGHPPGEYLPTILDVVGKLLYNARGFTGNFRSTRFEDANSDEISVGAFMTDTGSDGNVVGTGFARFLSGPRGENNKALLGNLILGSTGVLNHAGFTNRISKIELRYYSHNGERGPDPRIIAGEIREFLLNPSQKSNLGGDILSVTDQPEAFKIPRNKVVVREIDITLDNFESPSTAAWNVVRELQSGAFRSSMGDSDPNTISQMDRILIDNVVDAFVVFEDADSTISAGGGSQAEQEATAAVNAAVAGSRNVVNDD